MEEINETYYIHREPGASNVAEQSVAPRKVAVRFPLVVTCDGRTQARMQAHFGHLYPQSIQIMPRKLSEKQMTVPPKHVTCLFLCI